MRSATTSSHAAECHSTPLRCRERRRRPGDRRAWSSPHGSAPRRGEAPSQGDSRSPRTWLGMPTRKANMRSRRPDWSLPASIAAKMRRCGARGTGRWRHHDLRRATRRAHRRGRGDPRGSSGAGGRPPFGGDHPEAADHQRQATGPTASGSVKLELGHDRPEHGGDQRTRTSELRSIAAGSPAPGDRSTPLPCT